MKKNQKSGIKRFRDEVSEAFISCLETDPSNWKKTWAFTEDGSPYNPVSNIRYTGSNALWLAYLARKMGFTDARWLTFKQIASKQWHLKKGSHGARIEYYIPFNEEKKKSLKWSEYDKLSAEEQSKCSIIPKTYTVFNAEQVEGIPEAEDTPVYKSFELIEKVPAGIGVELHHDIEGSSSYYNMDTDSIHVPYGSMYKDKYAHGATVLHNCAHATAHENRLDRTAKGLTLAQEELVAEMSSCFMGEFVEPEIFESHAEDHMKFINTWAQAIKDNKKYLFDAIKMAQAAADFLIEKSGLRDTSETAVVA